MIGEIESIHIVGFTVSNEQKSNDRL